MQTRQSWEPPRLYSWEVEPFRPSREAPQQRVGGVTDNPERAIHRVCEALQDAPPGTRATIDEVALASSLREGYRPVKRIGTARRCHEISTIVWDPCFAEDQPWTGGPPQHADRFGRTAAGSISDGPWR
jgi:hypothetical protein